MPYALIIVTLFAAFNLLLLPVSYVCAIYNKYNYRKTQIRIKMKPSDMRWFVISGGLVLLGQALYDTYWFAVGLFQSRHTASEEFVIS